MTFKELQIKMLRDPVLGRLLPMECKKTFPRYELVEDKLYVSVLGVQAKPSDEGLMVKDPVYYLRLQYPQCRISRFVRLEGEKESRLMTQRDGDVMKQLIGLCDEVMQQYDRQAPGLAQTIDRYNALLNQVLEKEQLAVLDRMSGL